MQLNLIVFNICFLLVLLTILVIAKVISSTSIMEQDEDFIHSLLHWQQKRLERKGISFGLVTYCKLLFICPVCCMFFSYIAMGNGLFSILFACVGFFIPELMIYLQERKQKAMFQKDFIIACNMLVASLKVGENISQAVKEVANSPSISPSMRQYFARIWARNDAGGMSIAESFQIFADESNSIDARDLAIAIGAEAETGGREAEVVADIAKDMQQRIMLRKKIHAQMTPIKITIYTCEVVSGFLILFAVATKSSLEFYLHDSLGLKLLIFVLLSFVFGLVVNHTIIQKSLK